MTCIVGLAVNGRVWMGGDSAGVTNMDLYTRRDTKVFNAGSQADEFVLGFTDSFRMGQLLRFGLDDVVPPDNPELLYRWMVKDFIDAVRELLSAGGFKKIENEVEQGGTFLVGVCGRLFYVEGNFQVGENWCHYDAIGCGGRIALGAMYATSQWADPQERVHQALMAAEEFSAGVRLPFVIKSIRAEESE